MRTNPDDPAFDTGGPMEDVNKGMTKRELFVKDILHAIIAANNPGTIPEEIDLAIEYADKLIERLNKKEITNG